ncbi:hypothetical protein ACFLTP_03205 [Chloroflexota bacterium]
MVSAEGSGAIIITPHSPYGRDLYAQSINVDWKRLWGDQGIQINVEGAHFYWAINDTDGGIIIGHGDNIERLDALGNIIWTMKGFNAWAIYRAVSNGSGGALLLLYINGSGYLQNISSEGILLWGKDGVYVGEIEKRNYSNGDINYELDMVGDGYGGAIIVWQEKLTETEKIYAQRVSNDGETLWGNNGIPVSIAIVDQKSPKMTSDGNGIFIVIWTSISKTPPFYDSNIYAQKLNNNGQLLWSKQGVPVIDDSKFIPQPTRLTYQSRPQLSADGSGGAIIAWYENRRTPDDDQFAQRVNASGEILWNRGGVSL